MQEQDADLFIKLPARSENLSVIRHAVGNVARQHGMGADGIADLQIVVTEACSNVVVHAYCDRPRGALEVEANCEASDFGVAVRDYGRGFRAATHETEGLRLGLALISTIAPSFDVAERHEGGVEVNMRLPFPRSPDP